MEELIQSAKTIWFEINEKNTKYMCIKREKQETHQIRNIQVEQYKFEKVPNFKYRTK